MHVPPWELMEQPICWQTWILTKKGVEAELEKRRQKKQQDKSKTAKSGGKGKRRGSGRRKR